MLTRVRLQLGTRSAVALIAQSQAYIGNVIRFSGEDGWQVVQTGVTLPARLPQRPARNDRFTSSVKA